MSSPRLILVGGWGYPSSSLLALTQTLASHFNVTYLNSCECSGRLGEELDTPEPCMLAGWSMGGMLAIAAAATSEKVLGLVLISSTPRFFKAADSLYGIPVANIRAMSVGLKRRPVETMVGFYELSAAPHRMQRSDLERQAEQVLSGDTGNLLDGLGYLMRTELSESLSQISVPSLILHGASDEVIAVAAATELGDRLEQSTLTVRAAMGHDLPVRDSDWVATEILTFWKNRVAR